jgi:hypothetical protein
VPYGTLKGLNHRPRGARGNGVRNKDAPASLRLGLPIRASAHGETLRFALSLYITLQD